jgi:hypothetical protein
MECFGSQTHLCMSSRNLRRIHYWKHLILVANKAHSLLVLDFQLILILGCHVTFCQCYQLSKRNIALNEMQLHNLLDVMSHSARWREVVPLPLFKSGVRHLCNSCKNIIFIYCMTSLMLHCFYLRKPQPILKYATVEHFRPSGKWRNFRQF